MVDHGARDHAHWSASSSARNWQCPGALALQTLAPDDTESIHAARGTSCHQLAEKCLRDNREPMEFLGLVEVTKSHDIEIDEELIESAEMYVEYVRNRAAVGGQLEIEQGFSLADLNPPLEAGGTGDAVLYFPDEFLLEVVDLKNGRGVVEVQENKQLRTYGLGAVLANPGRRVNRVRVTIVQPRAFHESGKIRSEEFSVADLVEWTDDMLAAMSLSKQAMDEFANVTGDLTMAAWADKWLRPGACKFCRAEGFCPKLRNDALETVDPAVLGKWFEDITPKSNTLNLNDPARLAADLDGLDALEDWIKARRALAHRLAEQGTEIPGYQLADKIGIRAWAAGEEKVVEDLRAKGLSDDQIYERKLRSPNMIEKALGNKRKGEIENMWHRPLRGTNLVSSEKTTRAPAKTIGERFFEQGE